MQRVTMTARAADAGRAARGPTTGVPWWPGAVDQPKLMFGSPWASSPVVVRLQVPVRGAPAL